MKQQILSVVLRCAAGIHALGIAVAVAMPAHAEDSEIVERSLLVQDGHFTPDTIEVPSGRKIRLVVTNAGPGPEEFESSALGIESVMNAGVTRKVIIAPLKPGEYPFIGEFHSDTAKGKIVAK